MTFREKRLDQYDYDSNYLIANHCPYSLQLEDYKDRPCANEAHDCIDCWNRNIPEEKETYTHEEVKEMCDVLASDIEWEESEKEFSYSEAWESFQDAKKVSQKVILDSGERRQFETGAVRDIQEGKGRCDLMPLDVIATIYHHHKEDCHESWIFWHLDKFKRDGEIKHLLGALDMFRPYDTVMTMFLEVAKHFEEGAKKYGEDNWQKGIPTKHYIDSAIRHYLKYLRGDQDEPHDRAFVWNIMCCIWTCKNMPELNSYRKDEEDGNNNH